MELSERQIALAELKEPFPSEAYSSDKSRGFELTSIKAAFIIERLNDVFGLCGAGWRYAHSFFEEIHTESGRTEIVTEVVIQYRINVINDCTGCDIIMWDAQSNDWIFRDSNHDWSEPIFACGGKSVGKGGAAFTDARKSAVTDGLTKAASMVGIGHDVFKGLRRVGHQSTRTTKPKRKKSDPKPKPMELELAVKMNTIKGTLLVDLKPHQLQLVIQKAVDVDRRAGAQTILNFLSDKYGTDPDVTYAKSLEEQAEEPKKKK